MGSRLAKATEILLVFLFMLIGPRVFVQMVFLDFLAKYLVPWGLTNALVLLVLIYLYLFQETYQLKYRLLWGIFAIPTSVLIKFIFDKGWIVGTEYILGKIPFFGEWLQKVSVVINAVAIIPCLISVAFDVFFVLVAGNISGKIPVTNLRSSWYQTLQIIERWLPWNKD